MNSFLPLFSFLCAIQNQVCISNVLNPIGRFWIPNTGHPGAEDIAIDTDNNRIFTADGSSIAVNVLSYTLSPDLSLVSISLEKVISFEEHIAEATVGRDITLTDVTSVYYSSKGLILAGLIPADYAVNYGWLAFIDSNTLDLIHLMEIDECYLPDDITISDDGSTVILSCEGEPDDNEVEFPTYNPPGSVAVIDISSDNVADWSIDNAGFEKYDKKKYRDLRKDLYITHQSEAFSINAEPEYSVLSDDGKYGYIALQEQNAIAVLNVKKRRIIDIFPLGFNDYSVYGLDASDKDGKINIETYPNLYGLRAPDVIDYLLSDDGRHYIFTANEGDTKDFDVVRVMDIKLSNVTFGNFNVTELQKKENLGRLKVSNLYGQNDLGEYESLYTFSSRDFTIYEVIFDDGEPQRLDLIYSSNDIFERVTSQVLGMDGFNAGYYNPSFDSRSDDKGPEPEVVTVGKCNNGRKYVFVAMERAGGIFVFDITGIDRGDIHYVEYYNNRNYAVHWAKGDRAPEDAGDIGIEALKFVPENVYGAPILFAGAPDSSSVAMYRIDCGESPNAAFEYELNENEVRRTCEWISFVISLIVLCVIY